MTPPQVHMGCCGDSQPLHCLCWCCLLQVHFLYFTMTGGLSSLSSIYQRSTDVRREIDDAYFSRFVLIIDMSRPQCNVLTCVSKLQLFLNNFGVCEIAKCSYLFQVIKRPFYTPRKAIIAGLLPIFSKGNRFMACCQKKNIRETFLLSSIRLHCYLFNCKTVLIVMVWLSSKMCTSSTQVLFRRLSVFYIHPTPIHPSWILNTTDTFLLYDSKFLWCITMDTIIYL
jgi:hypothetical protein